MLVFFNVFCNNFIGMILMLLESFNILVLFDVFYNDLYGVILSVLGVKFSKVFFEGNLNFCGFFF